MNLIPKIVHLYWDMSPMSLIQTFTIDTIERLNPGWKIIVHIDNSMYGGSNRYIPEYKGKDYFYRVTNNSNVEIRNVDISNYNIDKGLHNILRSDIFRYHLLYNEGGVWSDFDVIWLKPMDYLSTIVSNDTFGATLCMFVNDFQKFHNISILVSAKLHGFYREAIQLCDKIQSTLYSKTPDHQEFGTVMFNKAFPEPDDVIKKFPDVINLKYETFFPYSIFNLERLYNINDLSVLTEDVMAVHWFNGHRLSKIYENDSSFVKNCSMTSILKNENLI